MIHASASRRATPCAGITQVSCVIERTVHDSCVMDCGDQSHDSFTSAWSTWGRPQSMVGGCDGRKTAGVGKGTEHSEHGGADEAASVQGVERPAAEDS